MLMMDVEEQIGTEISTLPFHDQTYPFDIRKYHFVLPMSFQDLQYSKCSRKKNHLKILVAETTVNEWPCCKSRR